jgi:hypothetical protein
MSSAASLVFPGSRSLGAWWRQLSPLRPRAQWVTHLLVHRVEALVRLRCSLPLAVFDRLALETVGRNPGASTAELSRRLHFEPQMVRQVLTRLAAADVLFERAPSCWEVTPRGQQSLEHGELIGQAHERRSFHFLEPETPGAGVHFVKLVASRSSPCPPPSDWAFDVSALTSCVRQPAQWKQRHGFPEEVESIVLRAAPDEKRSSEGNGVNDDARYLDKRNPMRWEQVVVDHCEHLVSVLILVAGADGAESLLGFAVHPEGWVLESSRPMLALDGGWRDVFPGFEGAANEDAWRQAWRGWARTSALAEAAVETCKVRFEGYRVRVYAPLSVLEPLRRARSEALRGNVWLLAGQGRTRVAACLEVLPASQSA